MNKPKYNRVLLKISGEQVSGKYDSGIDPEWCGWLAEEVRKVQAQGCQVVIMVGGGNIVRGAQIAGHGIKRVTGDQMGMLATMINALALTDVFEDRGISTRCLTNIFAEQVAEPFVHRLAHKHLDRGRVVIIGGGSGRPYMTTDTAAVVLALEVDCDIVLKATKVDGVYDKDPAKHDDATKFHEITYQQALESPEIKVMDKAAMGMALEQRMPLVIFDSSQVDSLAKIVQGEHVGTLIHN